MAMTGTAMREWVQQLIARGIVPPETYRVIIDIPCKGAVTVYYTCFADKQMFTGDLIEALVGAKAVHVGESMRSTAGMTLVDKDEIEWKPEPVGVTSESASPDEPVKG